MHNLTSFSFLHKRYHDNNAPVDLVFGVYSLNISIFFGGIYAHLRLLYASIRTLTRVLVFFFYFFVFVLRLSCRGVGLLHSLQLCATPSGRSYVSAQRLSAPTHAAQIHFVSCFVDFGSWCSYVSATMANRASRCYINTCKD